MVFSVVCMIPFLYSAHVSGGVFYASTDVLFLPPPASVGGNSLRADPGRTVYYAAIVERQFNGEHPDNTPRPTSAPLYGTGVRNGYAVYLPNAGGQWQTNFNKAAIRVEVVGESGDQARQQMDDIVQKLRAMAKVPQDEMGVIPESYISTELSPEKPNVLYLGVRNSRAEFALIMLTLGLAIGVAHIGDGLIGYFSRHRMRSSKRESQLVP